MRQTVVFLLYALPYVVFAGVCVIIGAAFFVPNLVFETFGSTELVGIAVLGGISLVVISKTKESMMESGREMLRRRHRS